MGRRRVNEGTGEATAPTADPPKQEQPKPSAAERTLDMFSPNDAVSKLGTTTPAAREDEIRKTQDDAIARARARAVQEAGTMKPPQTPRVDPIELERKLLSEETLDYDKAEREAIQAEANRPPTVNPPPATALDPAAFFGNRPVEVKQEFRSSDPDRVVAAAFKESLEKVRLPESAAEGDEVEVTKPEEMYGKTGSFCSYRVGPFRLKARTQPGQTRMELWKILYAEVQAMADIARETEKAKFLSHLPGAFTPTAAPATATSS